MTRSPTLSNCVPWHNPTTQLWVCSAICQGLFCLPKTLVIVKLILTPYILTPEQTPLGHFTIIKELQAAKCKLAWELKTPEVSAFYVFYLWKPHPTIFSFLSMQETLLKHLTKEGRKLFEICPGYSFLLYGFVTKSSLQGKLL